jgi:hypothetical protein
MYPPVRQFETQRAKFERELQLIRERKLHRANARPTVSRKGLGLVAHFLPAFSSSAKPDQ